MAQEIIDGTGTGKRAEVNQKNQLQVRSTGIGEFAEVSINEGKAWQLHFKRTILAANTFEVVGMLEYTGDNLLVLDNVVAAREDVALTGGNGQAHFDFAFGTEYVSGGSLQQAFTLNASSSKTLAATAYTGVSSTIVVDEANREKLFDLVTETSVSYDFKDALVLKKGDVLTIKAQSKNISDVMHLAVFVYEIEA
jgi:hypothetical protein